MPTVPFCALDDVYADWGFKKPNTTQQLQMTQQVHPSLQPVQKESDDEYTPKGSDLRNFCPNCNGCVKANDVLQQRIIEQNIWPRPRWTPQNPHSYVPYDPFNRYWMNNVPPSHREDFGMFENFGIPGKNGVSTELLLQIILFILIALFVIQLVEWLYIKSTG